MSKRVYKFRSAEIGLLELEQKHIKIATIDDLNDPFDLASVDTTNPAVNSLLTTHVLHFRENYGLLCFSRNWDNLLMWSHYGDSHTGLCLGFDIPDDPYDMDVRYQPNLLRVRSPNDVNLDLVKRIFSTKHESWSYEQEVRTFVSIKNEPRDQNGRMWFDFGPHLELKEVIVGSQFNPTNVDRLNDVLKKFTGVESSWAYMRSDAFLLVRSHVPQSTTFRLKGR